METLWFFAIKEKKTGRLPGWRLAEKPVNINPSQP
jgi:hypothetical protein